MTDFSYSNDYDDALLAELYDQSQTNTDDVEFLRHLIAGSGPLNVLECFSGTGRILVPLAKDGHRLTGIEMAASMSARAAAKIASLGPEVQGRVTLVVRDALAGDWGYGYDLVIIGANAFYELPSAAMQEQCIRLAAGALVPGGHLYVDNDDYKGDWGEGPFGVERVVFDGTGAGGVRGRETMVSTGFDAAGGVLHMERTWLTVDANGRERRRVLHTRKHPVSAAEVSTWVAKHGFDVEAAYGDRQGHPHTPKSPRAIFWARRRT